MRALSWSLLLAAIAALCAPASTFAQVRPGGLTQSGSGGGFTGGSMFSSGSSGLGGSSGGLGGGQGGLGGGQSGLGGGQGGLGGGQGGLGGGQGGLGGGQGGGLGGSNPFGQQNSGFIGRNGANNQFIGGNAQGQNGQLGNQTRQGGRNSQRNGGQNQQFNQNAGGQDSAQNRNAGVRPRQKIAFDHPTVETAQVVVSIESQLKKLSTKKTSLNDVKLAAETDGTVVMTGAVASYDDARLAELLVRQRPGVRGVRNEMTYPPPAVDAE